jgi:hypothetical protein
MCNAGVPIHKMKKGRLDPLFTSTYHGGHFFKINVAFEGSI